MTIYKYIFAFLLITGTGFQAFSQKKPAAKPEPAKDPKIEIKAEMDRKQRRADKLMNEQSFYNAIELYKEFEKEYPGHEDIIYKLGVASYISRDYINAEKYLKKYTANKNFKKYPDALFYLGETLKSLAKYEESQQAYIQYSRSKSKSANAKKYQQYAKNEITAIEWVKIAIYEDSTYIDPQRLLGSMNRAYSDFSPYPVSQDTLLFASMQEDSIIKYTNEDHHFSAVKLYETVRTEDGTWTDPYALDEFNTPYEHTANGIISPDGQYFYLTRCKPDRDSKIQCELCYTQHDNDKIKEDKVKRVKGINASGFTFTQPTFMVSERKGRKGEIIKTYTMYFVSDRPGGQGGKDIWYAQMEEPGKFKKPVNCGNRVNTPRDEVTPFYDNKTGTLYFSSNYHFGFGGQDIFKVKGKETRWAKPQNVMFPLNSSYDDTYYIPVANTKSEKEEAGYIVSNRPGGIALHSETCCDDIYYYIEEIQEKTILKGLIQEQITDMSATLGKKIITDQLKQTVEDTMKVYSATLSKQHVEYAYIGILKKKIYDRQVKNNDTSFATLSDLVTWMDTTASDGSYQLNLRKGKEYIIVVSKPGYKGFVQVINTNTDEPLDLILKKQALKASDTMKVIQMPKLTASMDITTLKTKDKFLVENMHFDSNSDLLRADAASALNIIRDFMNRNPKVKLEISGHTDSNGSDEYNMDLSQRRVESVMGYLIDKGIDEKRLSAKGYGETQPIAPNTNTDGSDNPEGRKLNRRTEVKITSH